MPVPSEDPFPKNLERIRRQRQLSQHELATAIGKREDDISRWEGRKNLPTFASARRLAQALDVPLDVLVSESADAGHSSARRGKRRPR